MYEAVRARPASPSTVARLAATAADYGYDGLVVDNSPQVPATAARPAVSEAYGVDVVDGVELRPDDPSGVAAAIGHHRPSAVIVCLRGGEPALNRYAVRQDRVDVLTRPMAGAGDLDHVLVRAAAEHGVRLSVDLGPVIRETGPPRAVAIAGLRKLRELLDAYEAPYVVTASPGTHLELRAPRDLAAVAAVAGFDREAIERGLAEWGRLAAQNRERRSEAYVSPGVRREADDR